MEKPLVLCILDGCGIRKETDGNAFANANKPTLNMLFEKYPNSILEASGKAVGLPEGQMGTSEVGHMNLGSGRVAMQPLENITSQIENGEILKGKKILIIDDVFTSGSTLHACLNLVLTYSPKHVELLVLSTGRNIDEIGK